MSSSGRCGAGCLYRLFMQLYVVSYLISAVTGRAKTFDEHQQLNPYNTASQQYVYIVRACIHAPRGIGMHRAL